MFEHKNPEMSNGGFGTLTKGSRAQVSNAHTHGEQDLLQKTLKDSKLKQLCDSFKINILNTFEYRTKSEHATAIPYQLFHRRHRKK